MINFLIGSSCFFWEKTRKNDHFDQFDHFSGKLFFPGKWPFSGKWYIFPPLFDADPFLASKVDLKVKARQQGPATRGRIHQNLRRRLLFKKGKA